MSINISHQQARQALLQQFCVAKFGVEDLLAFGEQKNQCFLVEKEKGVLEKPIRRRDWIYQQYNPDSNTLHPKAEECLDQVLQAGFPIRQIIYGYQEADVQLKTKSKPHIHIPDRTIETVGSIAKVALKVTAGAAMVLGYAFLMSLSALDPKLIVVLDTGAEEKELPWVCLMSWDQKPENS